MTDVKERIQPFFIYGTAWKEDQTEELTLSALQSGFRAIDTANQRKHYFEEGVGKGIKAFFDSEKIGREDLFIQTKFTYKEGQDHRLPYNPNDDYPSQVKQSFNSSLDHLNTDYLDSYILHGPSSRRGLNKKDYEVWQTMENLQEEGLARNIGVSNINSHQLQLLLDKAEIKPTFVQNRCFARNGWDKEIRQICDDNDIIYQGFSLLTANRNHILDPKIQEIAKNHSVSIPGLIFSFAKQVGMLPLTGTTQKQHMITDLTEYGTELSDKDIQLIERIAL